MKQITKVLCLFFTFNFVATSTEINENTLVAYIECALNVQKQSIVITGTLLKINT